MKVSATAVFLATALGVAAHPSGAAHQHMHKRLEFVKAGKPVPAPVKAVVEPSTVASPSAVATPSQAAPSNSGGSGAGVKSYTPFCGGNKRATVGDIAYKGNVGGSQYGCNMMLASLDVVDKYDYQAIFEETQGKDQKCVCWNKYGPTNKIDGFFSANTGALKFDLPAKSKQAVVFDGNSQGGCTCRVGEMTYTKHFMFDGTWFEFDFGNEANKKWSGADASSLAAHDDFGTVTAMTVECGLRDGSYSDKSIINADGSGTNSFTAGKNAEDGHGCNIPAGPAYAKIQV
ncbi:allergen Asp F4-like protein [Purpureocillium lilacinum]|uniref:Allergen Asp F4-like protein n=2 Tax=Purpureocillium lilacinum TaxID=33203 RepID=A0A179H0N1_PURLI|nr:allergen Asp F4-like protein [Purpureocillium lilacinum]KAK4088211.1 hypothetical protein Purlil1_7404 [Purpureocillium lilacinum]OAQ74928.1 allergen Asp F4-like protein [Purpureocillium lilacinum]OAQ83041.1 allergen Asp F4-like protein [Purpureocillium lilacinum]GJN70653.1 hypothetical protein PLICBS_004711 [Purpureocillium lilacinum]